MKRKQARDARLSAGISIRMPLIYGATLILMKILLWRN